MVSQLQRIVVRIEAVQIQLFRQRHRILHRLGIRDVRGRSLVRSHRRIGRFRLRPGRLPAPEPFLHNCPGLCRCHIPNHHNRRQIRPNICRMILLHIRQLDLRQTPGCGLSQRRIARRQQPQLQGAPAPVSRTLQRSRRKLRRLLLHHGERLCRKRRVQFVIRQQLHASRKIIPKNP